MYIKIHKSYRPVVAICDEELVGKKVEEGKRQLDIRENFFKGEQLAEQELIHLIKQQAKEDATFNIVGQKSIEAAIKAGVIIKNQVSLIQKIPFALTLL